MDEKTAINFVIDGFAISESGESVKRWNLASLFAGSLKRR